MVGPAFYLIHTASLHQHTHCYITQHPYIPSPTNQLADLASCHFNISAAALLLHLNSLAPHSLPWAMLPLLPTMSLWLTTNLQRQWHDSLSLASMPVPKSGSGCVNGSLSLTPWARTCFWKTKFPSSTS